MHTQRYKAREDYKTMRWDPPSLLVSSLGVASLQSQHGVRSATEWERFYKGQTWALATRDLPGLSSVTCHNGAGLSRAVQQDLKLFPSRSTAQGTSSLVLYCPNWTHTQTQPLILPLLPVCLYLARSLFVCLPLFICHNLSLSHYFLLPLSISLFFISISPPPSLLLSHH